MTRIENYHGKTDDLHYRNQVQPQNSCSAAWSRLPTASNHNFINHLISLAITFLASPYFLDIQNIGLSLYYNREKTTAHHDGKGGFTP